MTNNNLFIRLGLSEKTQILPDSNVVYIRQLSDERSKFQHALTQEPSLFALLLRAFSHYEGGKVKLGIIVDLSLMYRQVEGVRRENGRANSG